MDRGFVMEIVLKFLAAYKTYLIAAAAGAALVAGGWIWVAAYGSTRDAEGYARAHNEATAAALVLSEKYRAQEAAAQQDAEANYAKYRGMVLATQAGADRATTVRNGLLGQLAALRRSAAARPAAVGRTDGAAGPDFIGVIAACAGRYDEVVKYAAGLSDKVIGLQGYVGSVLRDEN
jgi:hypothetical protein